jgi:hypothetical protein
MSCVQSCNLRLTRSAMSLELLFRHTGNSSECPGRSRSPTRVNSSKRPCSPRCGSGMGKLFSSHSQHGRHFGAMGVWLPVPAQDVSQRFPNYRDAISRLTSGEPGTPVVHGWVGALNRRPNPDPHTPHIGNMLRSNLKKGTTSPFLTSPL